MKDFEWQPVILVNYTTIVCGTAVPSCQWPIRPKQRVADVKMWIKMNLRYIIARNFYTVKLRDTHYLPLVNEDPRWELHRRGRRLWMRKDKREMKTMWLFFKKKIFVFSKLYFKRKDCSQHHSIFKLTKVSPLHYVCKNTRYTAAPWQCAIKSKLQTKKPKTMQTV